MITIITRTCSKNVQTRGNFEHYTRRNIADVRPVILYLGHSNLGVYDGLGMRLGRTYRAKYSKLRRSNILGKRPLRGPGAWGFLNLLATDFFFQILAHPVFKMWVIQKPNKVALWNKRHFEEKKKWRLYSMFKIFSTDICWINIKWRVLRGILRPSYI